MNVPLVDVPQKVKKIAIKFLLSNSLTGSLIGTGGRVIKELIEVTNCRVNVSGSTDTYPGTSDRVVLLVGTLDSVSLAQTLIWEMIGLMTKTLLDSNERVEWSPKDTLNRLGQNEDIEVVNRFTLPAASGGLVLGKAGANIKKMAMDSGAKISMSTKEEALFTQERILTLTGTVGSCIRCTDMILAKLNEQHEVAQFVNRGTTYASPLNHSMGGPLNGAAKRVGPGVAPRMGFEAPVPGQQGIIGGGDAAAVADTTITLSVPDELIGNIFGKQGQTMREIISLSGAKVVVSARGEFAEGTRNRIVTITGSPTSAQSAHLFITQRLHTPSNPPPRRSTTTHRVA